MKQYRHIATTSHYRMSEQHYAAISSQLREAGKHSDINAVLEYLNRVINPIHRITSISFF